MRLLILPTHDGTRRLFVPWGGSGRGAALPVETVLALSLPQSRAACFQLGRISGELLQLAKLRGEDVAAGTPGFEEEAELIAEVRGLEK